MKPVADASAGLVRADVLVLLREKRYEEALELLYRARAESPESAELQKSIDQVKEFLLGAYAKRLGGLDRIAVPVPPVTGRSPDMVLLSRFIDGTSTYGDLAQICPLGKLRTLQVLIEMYVRRDAVQLLGADNEVPPDTARSASGPAESAEARGYRESFAVGTAAFIQGRHGDAIEAFEACARLRPGDGPAAIMLRRARRDLESR